MMAQMSLVSFGVKLVSMPRVDDAVVSSMTARMFGGIKCGCVWFLFLDLVV